MNSKNKVSAGSGRLLFREGVRQHYPDVLTPEALDALEALADFNAERRRIMRERIERRAARFREGRRIGFLDPAAVIPRTALSVQQAREGKFEGSEIPHDLQRQWIQGTGPATRPRQRWKRASATWPTPCSPAPTAGCSTARTPSARSTACRSTTCATSRLPLGARSRSCVSPRPWLRR